MTLKSFTVLAALMSAMPVIAADTAEIDPLASWQDNPAQVFEAESVDLDAFRWVARPIVVFADTPADPRFQEQMELLEARIGELVERDVIIITDSDPAAATAVRQKLRPRGFMMALLGKDGGVKLRKPFPWDVRELSRSIDKMPLRQDEIRARRESQE